MPSRSGARRSLLTVKLADPIASIPETSRPVARQLAEEGIVRVADLLLHLPFRYEDRSRFSAIRDLRAGEPALVSGRLVDFRLRRTRNRAFTILDAVVDDGTAPLKVRWFNRSYLARMLRPGMRAVLFGSPEVDRSGLLLKNAEHEFFAADEEADPIHLGRIVGIYRRRGRVSGKSIRKLVFCALQALDPDFLSVGESSAICDALRSAHFPEGSDFPGRAAAARRRLVEEEFRVFSFDLETRRAKRRSRRVAVWRAEAATGARLAAYLPFALTAAQSSAFNDIVQDVREGRPMARLLQGDVGSGKTAVALLAAMLAIENGRQVALMAPTELLAEQHAETFARLTRESRIRLAILTGRTTARARRSLQLALTAGEIDLLIGTHALLEDPVQFHELGLVVIDEQHRFGVSQRARLSRKGREPHLLVMTATPIPRSLAWTVFGDLDVSFLREKPPGRGRTRTFVRDFERRDAVFAFVGERLSAGERAFVVVPAIEESPREVAAVRKTFDRLTRMLPGSRGVFLHGRLPAAEREAAMRRFVSGEANLLVSTTVIEVGIDVPEATVLVVENAERFGLAQLHQLRGRVGRGPSTSYAIFLVAPDAGDEARRRVALLETVSDGFELAEKDLEWRGPGELLGERQSGLSPFQIADPIRDIEILRKARLEMRLRVERGEPAASDLFAAPPVIETARHRAED